MASKTIQATGTKGHHTFKLVVNETYVGNGAENFSKLSFSLTCNPGNWDWYGWGDKIKYSINIGGNTYSGSIPDMVANTNNTIRSVSGIKIPHNTDGTKNISISFSVTDGANQSYTSGNCSTSGTFYLTTILRYPQLTFDSFSSELNRIKVIVSNSLGMNMDKYQCAKVSDGTVVASGDLTSTSSATFYITGLTPNTSYSGTYKVRAYSNGGWGDWITLTNSNMKTTALPTVSSTANIDIENAVRIQFNNLNFIQKWSYVCKTYNDNTTVASGSDITTNNYDITLTSSQRSTLLNKYISTTKPKVYWEITITSNGTNYRVYVTGTTNPTTEYTIPDTDIYKPTFTSSYITEIKNTQSTISGTNKFIKNHNQLSLKITPMVGKYGTSGKNYTIVCGSKSTSVNYSSSAQTVILNNIDGDTVSITAVDNRGKATLVSIAITLINYFNPVINAGALTRQNGTGTYAYLNANGTYTNWSGLNSANSIQTVKYRYRQTGTSSWSSYVTISPSTNTGGNWTIDNLLLSTVFTNTLSYEVELYIADKFEATTIKINLSTADVFIWRDLANKRFGINKKPTQALDVLGNAKVSGNMTATKFIGTCSNSEKLITLDTRNVNSTPAEYMSNGRGVKYEFKDNNAIGNPLAGTYSGLLTTTPWGNNSGGRPTQMAVNTNGFKYRHSKDDENWGSWFDFGLLAYPVGSIYISVNNTNPGTLFGGTWVKFGAGRCLVGVDTSQTEFNTIEKIGGEKTHTLTIEEMPKHKHDGWGGTYGGGGPYYYNYYVYGKWNTDDSHKSAGGDKPHNNLQPYITVYMWKRTA